MGFERQFGAQRLYQWAQEKAVETESWVGERCRSAGEES